MDALAAWDDAPVAVAHLAGQRLAVRVQEVQQGLPCPLTLIPVPRRDGAVIGAISHQGQVVPVTDLRRWLPWPQGDTPPTQLLVLRSGDACTALLVDGVDGVSRARQFIRLHQEDNELDVFHTVAHLPPTSEDLPGQVCPLLDVGALLTLTATWASTADTDAMPATAIAQPAMPGTNAGTAAQPMAMLRIGRQLVAVPVANLVVVDRFPPVTLVMANSPILGVACIRGRNVPVCRPAAVMDIADEPNYPWLAVLTHDDHWIGLPVTAFEHMQAIDLAQLRPHSAAGFSDDACILGLATVPGHGPVLVPDVGRLAIRFPLGGPDNDSAPASPVTTARVQQQREAFAILESGHAWALPLRLMESALPLPADIEWLSAPASASAAPKEQVPAVARLRHRDDLLLIWDARQLTQAPADTPAPDKLVIVTSDERRFGILVNELRQIVPPHRGELFSLRRSPGHHHQFLTVAHGQDRKSFQILDLAIAIMGER